MPCPLSKNRNGLDWCISLRSCTLQAFLCHPRLNYLGGNLKSKSLPSDLTITSPG
jgi:hypothetical protein